MRRAGWFLFAISIGMTGILAACDSESPECTADAQCSDGRTCRTGKCFLSTEPGEVRIAPDSFTMGSPEYPGKILLQPA